jgi:glutamate/tyrosine decarboxylase-like PLP-dependent enzyme
MASGGDDPLALDPGDPLASDPEQMRELGYRVVDLLVDREARGLPALPRVSREETERRLGGDPPEDPEPTDELLGRLDDVVSLMARCDHPAFLAFIPGEPTWPGALADLVASALNLHAIDWIEAPGPTQVELTTLRWLCDWFGYPAAAGGVFVSGGSAANMTALACARETLLGAMADDVVVYVSDQAHSSMARAARVLGFRPEQLRVLPVDERYRMRPETLSAAIEADARAGRNPLFVSVAAGSTNTGAIDPLPELADVTHAAGAWFHVDAAYGGGAILSQRRKRLLDGIERADSITVDPHKWMYQPIECGVLLVRDLRHLHGAFEITPDYMQDLASALHEPNFSDLGMQLTRSARALKLWMSVHAFGLRAFRDAVDRSLDLTQRAAERIEASPSLQLLAEPSLGIVCFRRTSGNGDDTLVDALNARLVTMLADSGIGFISSTRLRGRYTLRLCILNHSTTWGDVDAVLTFLERAEVDEEPREERSFETRREATAGWLRRARLAPDDLRTIPLFEGLDRAALERIERVSSERTVGVGTPLIEQWDATRDLLVLLEGTAEVIRDGRHVRDVPTGDFVGEIAALGWHAGYTYARTATVVATSPVRLLVVPGAIVPDLVRDLPVVEARLRAAVGERLSTL